MTRRACPLASCCRARSAGAAREIGIVIEFAIGIGIGIGIAPEAARQHAGAVEAAFGRTLARDSAVFPTKKAFHQNVKTEAV